MCTDYKDRQCEWQRIRKNWFRSWDVIIQLSLLRNEVIPPTTVGRNKMWESISKAASGTRFSILLNTTVIEVPRDTHTGKQLSPSGHRDQSSQEICMHSLEEDCVISHASQ